MCRAGVAVDAAAHGGRPVVPQDPRGPARWQRRHGRHRVRGEPGEPARLATRLDQPAVRKRARRTRRSRSSCSWGAATPAGSGENNLIGNPAAAETVAASWPTKVVYSGYEVGYGVFTGHTLSSVHPANSPIRVAYEALVGPGKNNRSFDVTALYHALQPADPLLTEVGPGTNAIDSFGDNVFTPGAGDEYYLTNSNATALQNTLEGLMDVLPGTTPQAITFTSAAPAAASFGSTYAPSATGGASGDPVTFAIDPSSTSGCSFDGTTGLVTFASPAGTCVIDADQGGSTVFAAAPRQSQSVIVGTGIAQTVSFTTTPPASAHVGDTYAVGATSTSGLPVTISIDPTSTSGCTYAQGTGLVDLHRPRRHLRHRCRPVGQRDLRSGAEEPAVDRPGPPRPERLLHDLAPTSARSVTPTRSAPHRRRVSQSPSRSTRRRRRDARMPRAPGSSPSPAPPGRA